MEKKDQLLNIHPPNELKFRGPFTKPVTTYMRLNNPTDKAILFKIKTTAPRKYCVRPNFGSVDPHSTVEVGICLQAFIFDANEKNKHKFMVQSMVVPDDEKDYDTLWKEVAPENLMDSKLRCVFELPVDATTNQEENLITADVASKDKASKAGGDDKQSSEVQVDYARAAAEVRQLREEESHLRQENLQLKEELLKLRLSLEGIKKEQPSSTSSPYQNPYSPPQLGQQQVPVMYIALAIAMAVVGVVFGKYLL